MPAKKKAAPAAKSTAKRPPKPRAKRTGPALNELLAQLAAGGFGAGDAEAARDRAQEIALDAWQASSAKKAAALARKALAVSADCADAYNILAKAEAKTLAERLALYEAGVQAGRRALGKEYKKLRGEFWGFIETRPYMRSREGMADCLWELGRREESLACHREMLALNPNDNQGVRYVLLGHLLELGLLTEAEEWLIRYEEDDAVWWTYGGALAAFLAEGASTKAARRLAAARKSNPHVSAYLLGTKRLPKRTPDYYSPGADSEAVSYALGGAEAWAQHPTAREWLAEAVAARGPVT